MLSLWRTEEFAPQLQSTDLSELVTESVLRFEAVAFEAGHPLHYDIENALSVAGEGKTLRRLVTILLDNAVKYAAPGTPIRLVMDKVNQQVVFTVENEGDPIPAEKLPHLFDRFYRVDDSREETSGFGLGLAIAREIVHKHGGTISVRSDVHSTAFCVTLPLL